MQKAKIKMVAQEELGEGKRGAGGYQRGRRRRFNAIVTMLNALPHSHTCICKRKGKRRKKNTKKNHAACLSSLRVCVCVRVCVGGASIVGPLLACVCVC